MSSVPQPKKEVPDSYLVYWHGWQTEFDFTSLRLYAGELNTIILISHGEFDNSDPCHDAEREPGSMCPKGFGTHDRKLTREGHASARELADKLNQNIGKTPIDYVYTGPNYALLQTLQPVWAAIRDHTLTNVRVNSLAGCYNDRGARPCHCDVNARADINAIGRHFPDLSVNMDSIPNLDAPAADRYLPLGGESGPPEAYKLRAWLLDRIMREIAADSSKPKTILICTDPASVFILQKLLQKTKDLIPATTEFDYPKYCTAVVLNWRTADGKWSVNKNHTISHRPVVVPSIWWFLFIALCDCFPTTTPRSIKRDCAAYWSGNRYSIPWFVFAVLGLSSAVGVSFGLSLLLLNQLTWDEIWKVFASLVTMTLFFFPPVLAS